MPSFNSGQFQVYDSAMEEFVNGTQDWDTDDHYAILLLKTYTIDTSHGTYTDISSHESSATDYDAKDLTGETVTLTGGVVKCDANDVSWGPPVTLTAAYIAILQGTAAGKTGTDEIVGVMPLDRVALQEISVDEGTLTVGWSTDGLFRIRRVADSDEPFITVYAHPGGAGADVVSKPINRAAGISAAAAESPFDLTSLIEHAGD